MSELEIPVAEPVEFTPELLTEDESAALTAAEEVIGRGLNTFVDVGKALLTIRDTRLYRADFATFEDYCAQRWQISRPRGYELMQAARVVSAIADTGLPPPANEAQARELAKVSEEDRAEVWQKALEETDGKPTAAAIKSAARAEPSAHEPPGTVTPARDRQRPASGQTPSYASEPTVAGAAVEEPSELRPDAPERPATDRGRAAVQQMVEEERQRGEYLRNFHAALSKSGSAWSYDAERVGREASPETFTAIEANVSAAVHWLATARKARSGLRVINGGAS